MTVPLLVPLVGQEYPAYSPLWWVGKLHAKLHARQAQIDVWERYALGDHDDPLIDSKASVAFRHLLGLSKTNITGLIVETAAGRLGVQGFRFGDDPDADSDAWRIWQASDMDAQSELLFTAALTRGRSFILVEPPQVSDGLPALFVESARQMIVAYESGRPSKRLAALKVWADEWTGEQLATLYLPGTIHKYRAPGVGAPMWTLRTADVAAEINPLGEVPVFELRNRPLDDGSVRSEIADVIGDQDALNDIALDMLVAAKYGAFPQKWVTGMTVPRVQDPNYPADPSRTVPVEPFTLGPNRILIAEEPETTFGSFTAADLLPYVGFYDSRLEHMAATSQTPIGFLRPQSNVSAEAMAMGITEFVNKLSRRQLHYEQAPEDALRCCFRSVGDPRAEAVTAETIWENADIQSLAQKADAAVKFHGDGVNGILSRQGIQENIVGMTETERARDLQWREEGDALSILDRVIPNVAGDPNVPQ